MSKSLKLTTLLKSTFSKNVSEEKFETFHQIWSWSWRLCTRSCFGIKKKCQSNTLLQYPISKNISEEKVKSFHQVWSWSWKRITSRILSNLWNIIPMCMLGIGGLPLKIILHFMPLLGWGLTHFSPIKVCSRQKIHRSCIVNLDLWFFL